MSHIGLRSDLRKDGKPLRVTVIGQEAGSAKVKRVTVEERYQHIYQQSGIECRYNAETGHQSRNPHMRGTTSALRIIFGKGLGKDYAGEWVQPEKGAPFHVFDGFALVNRLLCFAGPKDSRQGRGTKTMLTDCRTHFAATLSILEPTILIIQGRQAATGPAEILGRGRIYSENVHEAFLKQQRMVVCDLSHPSTRGELRWGDRLDSPYLTDTVFRSLELALRKS